MAFEDTHLPNLQNLRCCSQIWLGFGAPKWPFIRERWKGYAFFVCSIKFSWQVTPTSSSAECGGRREMKFRRSAAASAAVAAVCKWGGAHSWRIWGRGGAKREEEDEGGKVGLMENFLWVGIVVEYFSFLCFFFIYYFLIIYFCNIWRGWTWEIVEFMAEFLGEEIWIIYLLSRA